MIQNLNFYDIYGYLIPGLTLAILIWLPQGLIMKRWPTVDWTSAVVAVVIGYVIGHVVQAVARNAIPSSTMNGRLPSEVLLDKDDHTLSPGFKSRLRDRILKFSGINVRTDLTGSQLTPEARIQRRDGFYFCRDAVLTSKTISYGEQMQGMYALMDGLTAAFALGTTYNLGWALSGTLSRLARGAFDRYVWIMAGLALALATAVTTYGLLRKAEGKVRANTSTARLVGASIMLALLASGYVFGLGQVATLAQRGQLLVVTLAGAFACVTCFSAYKYFTIMYAMTIYRTFDFYEKPSKPAEKP